MQVSIPSSPTTRDSVIDSPTTNFFFALTHFAPPASVSAKKLVGAQKMWVREEGKKKLVGTQKMWVREEGERKLTYLCTIVWLCGCEDDLLY